MQSITDDIFSKSQWQELNALLAKLSHEQSLWLSGYLAASIKNPLAEPATSPVSKLVIAYGTETGNSKALAEKLHQQLPSQLKASVSDLADLKVAELTKFSHLLIITSTHGDGDPPETAEDFYNALMQSEKPLANLNYSVLALGDSTYTHFCVTGRNIDEQLAKLGAQQLIPRVECDVDFEEPAAKWITELNQKLSTQQQDFAGSASVHSLSAEYKPSQEITKSAPLTASVLDNIILSDPNSPMPIHHIELDIPAGIFDLAPGDSVGVLAENPPEQIRQVLDILGFSGDENITVRGEAISLLDGLKSQFDLNHCSIKLLERLTEDPAANSGLDKSAVRSYLKQHHLTDILRKFAHQADLSPQDLVNYLRPLQPRLYDVANVVDAETTALHLCVKRYQYTMNGQPFAGVASTYLADAAVGDPIHIYPHKNKRFHLPDSQTAPLIMVADGTGIAPFRAFIEQIAAGKRQNPCWLLFREARYKEDFLYQTDWQSHLTRRHLNKLDVHFYQDQPELTLFNYFATNPDILSGWLNAGAHLYLSGDKTFLTWLETELENYIQKHLLMGSEWQSLKQQKRLHKNLY